MSAAGRADDGFTLIEMLVVLAALGLIGGLVYPAMTRLGDAGRLRTVADRVAGVLATARAHALRAAVPTRVDAGSLPAAGEARLAIAPAAGIVFYPDGSATGGGIAIVGARGTIRYAVTPATGRIVRTTP